MDKQLAIAGLNGFLAVGFAAFGAHALRSEMPEALRSAYETGGEMHLAHAIVVAATAVAATGRFASAFWLWLAGTALFSGSLYAYALGGPHALVFLTPIGGVILMLGWLALAWAGLRLGPEKDA